jgi:hypothetical protein
MSLVSWLDWPRVRDDSWFAPTRSVSRNAVAHEAHDFETKHQHNTTTRASENSLVEGLSSSAVTRTFFNLWPARPKGERNQG